MRLPPALLALAALVGCTEPDRSDDDPGPGAPPYDVAAIERAEADRRPERVRELRAVLAQLERAPGDASAHLAAGRALLLLDRAEAARWHLARAADEAGASRTAAQARYQLGVLELRESRPAEAAEAFRASLAQEPGFAPAHRDLGRALRELGDDAGARGPLERAWELDPGEPETALLLALMVEGDDPERAVALLEAGSSRAPYHLGVHANLAALYRRLGRSAEAEAARARHRELVVLADLGQLERPEDPDRYLAESRYYAQHDQWERAAEVSAAGLAMHPTHPELHFLHGMVSGRAEGPDAAQAAYLRSLELRPGDRRVLEELAALYLADPRPEPNEAARALLEEAAGRWPDGTRFAAALARMGASGPR